MWLNCGYIFWVVKSMMLVGWVLVDEDLIEVQEGLIRLESLVVRGVLD